MQTFKTVFENQTEQSVHIYDNGKMIEFLQPGWRNTLESISPLTDFARYENVTWSGGLPILETRKDWKEPDRGGKWLTEFINIDGRELEERDLGGGQKVYLPIGIPIVRVVPLGSRFILARRVEIRICFEKKSSGQFPGYLSTYQELRDVFEFRTEEEKAEIFQEIKALEQPQKNVAETEKKFDERSKQ